MTPVQNLKKNLPTPGRSVCFYLWHGIFSDSAFLSRPPRIRSFLRRNGVVKLRITPCYHFTRRSCQQTVRESAKVRACGRACVRENSFFDVKQTSKINYVRCDFFSWERLGGEVRETHGHWRSRCIHPVILPYWSNRYEDEDRRSVHPLS